MHDTQHQPLPTLGSAAGGVRIVLLVLFALLVIVVAGGVVSILALRHSATPAPIEAQATPAATPEPEQEPDDLSKAVVKVAPPVEPREKAYVIPSRPTSNAPATAESSAVLPASSAYSQQLIQQLAQTDLSQSRITPEQAAALKQNFKTLVGQGAPAVAAIRQFLDRNQDISFEDPGGNQVGYSSLRSGLFDALKQIGGPEATQALASTLRSTADPSEIMMLGKYLEEQAPGTYRADIVNAARDTLDQVARGQVQVRDAGGLFQALQTYGDANVVADLEKTPQYHYYVTMAMAGLPDGQGIPALAQRVQEATASGQTPNNFDLQMLAQMAAQYPDAAKTLVDEAKNNRIPERAWTKIIEGLAGDQYQIGKPPAELTSNGMPPAGLKTYHIESGNQNFYSLPVNLYGAPDQMSQRQAVVDQLLAATQNPAAVQALQNARTVLAAPAPHP